MRISRKLFNTFNRINEKLKTIPVFFITNYQYLIKKYYYLREPRYIVKCRLKSKRKRVTILFNRIKKVGAKRIPRKQKKNPRRKRSSKKHYKKFIKRKCPLKKSQSEKLKKLKQKPIVQPDIIEILDDDDQPKEALKSEDNPRKGNDFACKNDDSETNSDRLQRPELKEGDKISSANSNNDEKTNIQASFKNINEEIRESLKLLQGGRRSSISLLKTSSRPSAGQPATSSYSSTPTFSRHASHSSLENEITSNTVDKTPKSDYTSSDHTSTSQKPKFLDSLINKLKTQGLNMDASQTEDAAPSSPDKSLTNISRKSVSDIESPMKDSFIDDDQLSDHSTSSKNDFLGFRENEAQFERLKPGMLPTPVVENSKGAKSAFVSEELDNFMKENALDNTSYTTAPLKKRHDEAMMYAEAEPPSLLCPQLPSDVEKPRTVAEKRQLLERKADIKYLMIENESTVYRELRKRSKTGPLPNYNLIRSIQEMNIPFTRDCWRATCWLNTPNGRFYFQTINDDGRDIKVLSGRGNNVDKELCKLPKLSKKKIYQRDCTKSCKLIGNFKVNGVNELLSLKGKSIKRSSNSPMRFTSKKLNTLTDSYLFRKPGPLSLKKLNPFKSAIDVELGPLELYNLPRIQLQVWPKIDRPLPDLVHPYLKLALPYHKITPEWAEFALSTLKPIPQVNRRKRKRTKEIKESNKSFTFNIPYTNNQSRILVRKRRKIDATPMTTLMSINDDDDGELSFMKNVDKNNDVAVSVAEVLSGMIKSVDLTICENTVIKDDPDIDYAKVDGATENAENKLINVHANDERKKKSASGKIVKELKKLNAKIIHGFDTVQKECNNAFCTLGCVCDSLRGAQTYSHHCKEVKCMFECKCPISKINTSTFESAVHNSDIKQYCDRMNASLAKEEKDFTATIVVSDGKTIYVPRFDEKKKRSKKVPKRLRDCVQFESEFVHRDISDTLQTKEEQRTRVKKEIVGEDETVVTNENDIVRNMIHVNVKVERLDILDKLEPWCMVHCLYKCYCSFNAVEGECFEFGNTKIDTMDQPIYTKKRQYTFERNKDEPPSKTLKVSKFSGHGGYLESHDLCRRVCVVATTKHKIINAARSVDVRKRIKRIEEEHPSLKVLLKNRVKRSTLLAEVGPLLTVDPPKVENAPAISTEDQSFAEESELPPANLRVASDIVVPEKKTTKDTNVPASSSISVPTSSPSTTDPITVYPSKYRTRFNNIIMKTMHGISQRLKNKTNLPSPVNKALNCIQWKYFLQAFNADQIYIWEVQLSTKEVLLVVTDKNIMPIVSNAIYVINIKAVSTERLPVLPKLIKLGITNVETEKMSILLFGISNYWRVLGCTHSVIDFLNQRVVAIPTPDTDPRLASKISNLFDDMIQLKSAAPKSDEGKSPEVAMNITSNICIRSLDNADIDKIHLPIPVVGLHRWLMLTLSNDFSHIFVPPWKHFLTYDKIQNAIAHAKKTKKTVRMGPANAKPHVYVPHNSDMKIFFGPMKKSETLNLQLLQHFDGKLLLREDYQRIAKPQRNGFTIGTWLYMKDDHVMLRNDSPETTVVENKSEIIETDICIKLERPEIPTLKLERPEIPTLKLVTRPVPELQKFIPLNPSTITSSNTSNLNITLVTSNASSSNTSNSTSNQVSSPVSTTSPIPSSELIRHLSFGLRARPPKVSTIISSVQPPTLTTEPPTSSATSPIKKPIISVRDPASLLSPAINQLNNPTPPLSTFFQTSIAGSKFSRGSATTTSSEVKSVTVSLSPHSLAGTSSLLKEMPVIRPQTGVPIRERRYTTFVPSNLAQRNVPHKPCDKPQKSKIFELLQGPKTIKLAQIPTVVASSQQNIKPLTLKPIDSLKSAAPISLLRQRSNTIHIPRPVQLVNRPRPLSPSFATTKGLELRTRLLKPITITKQIIPPLAMLPITPNLMPSTVKIKNPTTLEGKSIIPGKSQGMSFNTLSPVPTKILMKPTATVNTLTTSEGNLQGIAPRKILLKPRPTAITTKTDLQSISRNIKLVANTAKHNPKLIEIVDCDEDGKPIDGSTNENKIKNLDSETDYPINGFFVCQIRDVGKIRAKKLREGYTFVLPLTNETKYFLSFKLCVDYLNNVYIKNRIFALVPSHLVIEWKFVFKDEDHRNYLLHNDKMLTSSMVLTRDGKIDLHSDFDLNEKHSMDLRHHLLVLKLANACMKNLEARHKTGLQIVKKSEQCIKELIAENKRLESVKTALQIQKNLSALKLNELKKRCGKKKTSDKSVVPLSSESKMNDIITIDSDDD